MTFRGVLNALTFAIVVLLLWLLRDELVRAWELLGRVDLWLLALIIPLQGLSYYASGATMFSFLKQRGHMSRVTGWDTTRMALELNFVNHILPTAGVSGASYMTWRLSKLGVGTGRATLVQVVRFAAIFGSFILLLMLAVLLVTLDNGINRFTILTSSALVSGLLIGAMIVWYVIDSERRLNIFSGWIARAVNWISSVVFRIKKPLISKKRIKHFLDELQDDYRALKKNPKLLGRPFVWGVIFNITEVGLFFLAFLSLGVVVNPAIILIALGVAAAVGTFLVTPGGAGGYEAVMVLVLTTSGVSGAIALAGVLLARVILILLTIGSGYFFYHQALKKYGRHPA